MLTGNQLKYYSSLKLKKFRQRQRVFLAEGEKIVHELLNNSGIFEPLTLLALPEYLNNPENNQENLKILTVSRKELERISSLSTPNQVVLEIRIPEYTWSVEELKNQYSLYFENIQDPGNMGTIIRTADWFGIRNIFCSPGSVEVYNPKVVQASMGSISRVRVHFAEPHEILSIKKDLPGNFQSIATTLGGQNIYNMEFSGSGILFFGNESAGLSDEISASCDLKVKIPGTSGDSGAESLNLSISTGIILSELHRRKIIQSGN